MHFFWIFIVAATTLFAESPLVIESNFTDFPFAFIRRKKEVGFEIDLIKEIAKQLGREPVFVTEGAADIRLGGLISNHPYMNVPLCVMIDSAKHPEFCEVKDVKGRIATYAYGVDSAKEFGEAIAYDEKQTLEAIVALMQGKVDAFFLAKPAALYLQFASHYFKIIGEVEGSNIPLGFTVHESGLAKEIAEVQKALIIEGVVERIYHKWFGFNYTLR